MTVYIQTHNKLPFNIDAMTAYYEYKQRDASIRLFDTEKLNIVPRTRDVMLVASVENTEKWFKDMNWSIPSMTIPHQLSSTHWTDRNISKMSLGEAINKPAPYFIKSYELKRFDSMVIEKEEDKKWLKTTDMPDITTQVLVSDVINFSSEWRCYILEGKIIGICHYSGDLKYYPDYNRIYDMVRQYSEAPKFYSLDVGITVKKNLTFTNLVECNAGFSLGNYGLSPQMYVRGLTTYWRELLEKNSI